MRVNTEQRGESFLETYEYDISPKLKSIDLFIKSTEDDFDIAEVARLLYLTLEEVEQIIKLKEIKTIDKHSFFTIMRNGSSDICNLFRRELECGSPYIYTKENISYIYGLDQDTVNKACESLHIMEVTAYTLPILFSHILV